MPGGQRVVPRVRGRLQRWASLKASWWNAATAKATGQQTLSLLLVGRVEPFLDFHSSVLKRNQIGVTSAAPGPEVLNLVQRGAYDLIFVDERPTPDAAWELVHNLKSLPMTDDVPVVLISSAAVDVDPAGRPASDALLERPFRERQFLDTIRHFSPLRERRHHRYPVNLRFSFRGAGRSGQAFSRVISYSGAFLKTDRTVPRGTRLELSFRLPGEGLPIECAAVVRNTVEWGVDPSVTPGFGVEFEELAGPDDARLAAFLAALEAHLR